LATIMDKENIDVFERQMVLSKAELAARTEILLEAYSMQINIEALTMINIAKRQILPASAEYSGKLAAMVVSIGSIGLCSDYQKEMFETVSGLIGSTGKALKELEAIAKECTDIEEVSDKAEFCRDKVIPAMNKLRSFADELENNVDANLWPLPTYAEMLFIK